MAWSSKETPDKQRAIHKSVALEQAAKFATAFIKNTHLDLISDTTLINKILTTAEMFYQWLSKDEEGEKIKKEIVTHLTKPLEKK